MIFSLPMRWKTLCSLKSTSLAQASICRATSARCRRFSRCSSEDSSDMSWRENSVASSWHLATVKLSESSLAQRAYRWERWRCR